MKTTRKLALLAMMVLGTAVLAGCSCATNDCAPPPPPPPRPRPAPVVCDPCAAPLAVAPISAPVCTTGVCQIVPPGATVYSDPPTVTVSATGQVVDSTPVRYYTSNSGYSYAPYPQATAVSTYNVPRSSNVRTI